MEEADDNRANRANSEEETDSLQQLDPITQATMRLENTLKIGNFRLAGDEIEELLKSLEGKELDSARRLSQRFKLDPLAIIIGVASLIFLLAVAALTVFH